MVRLRGFPGSYDPADVTFLLKAIDLPLTEVNEKERLIQSGERHYSEMLSAERPPTAAYMATFRASFARNRHVFAQHLALLAAQIATEHPQAVTLVSLARAGTPVGVLLARLLRQHHGRRVRHFSVSIIRDRGIDEVALRHILEAEGCADTSVVFVDGWTGKGVIAEELWRAVASFNARHGCRLPEGLHVLADLSGTAAVAATSEDYLIPSSVLNGTISGLVSRSVLNREHVGPGDFHGCVVLRELASQDLSRWFVDEVMADLEQWRHRPPPSPVCEPAEELRERSQAFLASMRERFGVTDVNHVKPGIGEATRVLLRRVPERLLLRDADWPDVAHLRLLAAERGVPEEIDPALPYRAAALIRTVD